jgi:hypothetical protein
MRSTSGTLSTSLLFTGEQLDAKARPSQRLYYLHALPAAITALSLEQSTGRPRGR